MLECTRRMDQSFKISLVIRLIWNESIIHYESRVCVLVDGWNFQYWLHDAALLWNEQGCEFCSQFPLFCVVFSAGNSDCP